MSNVDEVIAELIAINYLSVIIAINYLSFISLFRKGSKRANAKPRITDSPSVCVCVS